MDTFLQILMLIGVIVIIIIMLTNGAFLKNVGGVIAAIFTGAKRKEGEEDLTLLVTQYSASVHVGPVKPTNQPSLHCGGHGHPGYHTDGNGDVIIYNVNYNDNARHRLRFNETKANTGGTGK